VDARVLIVDDEPDMLENCERLLGAAGCGTRTLADPTQVRSVLHDFAPDVLLLDLRMPGADGMSVLAAALADDPHLPVVMMTAYASVASAVAAIREGAFDYLTKPFTGDQLRVAVERASRYRGLTLENRRLRADAERQARASRLVGESVGIRRVLERVAKVAPTDANVLITGESGTGKELVAQLLHAGSPRRAKPFVPIDCAALPETLLESELFGHEKGAFTGAIERTTGLLVAANGGTVFLDEIGELSTGLQAKLLRALEERTLRPVGSTRTVDVDIRLVTATNLALEEAVEQGTFRSDLYYRLNVLRIDLPPLRERRDDIPLLARTFLEEFAARQQRDPPQVSPEAWTALEAYDWPGNVRELRNVVQRLVIMDEDGRVTSADLPDIVRGWAGPRPESGEAPLPYERARAAAAAAFRREYVQRLLAQHGGNVSRAARAAGVSRRTLHRMLAEQQTGGEARRSSKDRP